MKPEGVNNFLHIGIVRREKELTISDIILLHILSKILEKHEKLL